jgi:hypothetical protein
MRTNMGAWASCVSGAIKERDYIDKMRRAGFVEVAKVRGGENPLEPVYSAKIIAVKPGAGKLPVGWGERVATANAKSGCGG